MSNQYTPKPSINEREMRGQSIAQNFGWVRRVDEKGMELGGIVGDMKIPEVGAYQ